MGVPAALGLPPGLPVVPVDVVPVLPGGVLAPPLMLPLTAALLAGWRTTGGITPGRSFKTSSGHGAVGSVDSVLVVQRRSSRSAFTPDGLVLVWASAEPASSSAASEASETREDLFMAYSFSERCSGRKSSACR